MAVRRKKQHVREVEHLGLSRHLIGTRGGILNWRRWLAVPSARFALPLDEPPAAAQLLALPEVRQGSCGSASYPLFGQVDNRGRLTVKLDESPVIGRCIATRRSSEMGDNTAADPIFHSRGLTEEITIRTRRLGCWASSAWPRQHKSSQSIPRITSYDCNIEWTQPLVFSAWPSPMKDLPASSMRGRPHNQRRPSYFSQPYVIVDGIWRGMRLSSSRLKISDQQAQAQGFWPVCLPHSQSSTRKSTSLIPSGKQSSVQFR